MAISVLLLFLAISRPSYATCGTVICQAYGNEGTRRPTIPAYSTPTVHTVPAATQAVPEPMVPQ